MLHSVVLKCQVAIMLALVHGTVATRTKDVLVHVLWVSRTYMGGAAFMFTKQKDGCSCAFICKRLLLYVICTCASLTLSAHAQRGLLYLVCVSVCVSVCLSPLILALQGPSRLISNTNGSSATRARKIMWRFCLNGGVREIWH